MKWKKCFHHICTRWKCSKENHLWCFKIHASFVLISCYKSIACKQVTQMTNYQTSSEATTSSHAQTELAWPLSNKTEMCTAQEIADDLSVFLTTLTSFCVYIINAKLSVKLLCRIKLCLLLWLGFLKRMKLLLSVRRDLSVRSREITLVLNRVQSAAFRWWHFCS